MRGPPLPQGGEGLDGNGLPGAVDTGEERDWPRGMVDDLHGRGFSCLALALDDEAVAIDSPQIAGRGRRALFFGSEGYGLSAETLAACDRKVIIPMSNGVDSLNVAASSAVAFWELFSRRG